MKKKWLTTRQKAEEQQLSRKQVLRQARKGLYPGAYQLSPKGEWRFPTAEEMAVPHKALTAEEIVIEEERKQAVLAHFEDLRAIARRWNRELWLPPPWHWDVAHLDYVFYVDTEKVARGKGVTGYKLPADLVGSEKSQGHFRHFEKGDIHWMVQDDGSIVLKLLVEHEVAFSHLKAHAQESPAWRLFAKWKEEGGIYIQLCSSLLARIEQDAKQAAGAKSELFWWTIYRDAFYIKDTGYRCEACGAPNAAGSRFCQACHLPLGWLRPLAKGYERATNHPQLSPIYIPGWGNIEESVEIERFEGMKRGHATLIRDKYLGCSLVETILGIEKEVKEIGAQLNEAVESLSRQKVFSGSCEACLL